MMPVAGVVVGHVGIVGEVRALVICLLNKLTVPHAPLAEIKDFKEALSMWDLN